MRTAQLLLLSILLTGAAKAQTFEDLAGVRLNDTTPRSTRAIALGGASDSLGDVDIAANPATLVNVKRPMISVQAARNSLGFVPRLLSGLTIGFPQWTTAASVSQVAAAVPLRGVVAGVYYSAEPRMHSPDPLVTAFGTTPYVPLQCPECDAAGFGMDPVFVRTDRRYGIVLAWERGPVAIGAGAEWQQLREETESMRAWGLSGVPEQRGPSQIERLFQRVNDRAVVPNVAVRWRATPRLALAAAYNGAGSFTRTTSICSTTDENWRGCTSAEAPLTTSAYHRPDAWRGGATFAATERLLLAAEAVRRNYGRLADDFYIDFGDSYRLQYHEVTEFHAGAEYKLSALPVALRAGWWRDPSRLDSPVGPARANVMHRTVGAGINVGRARLDVAYDHSTLALQRRAVAGITFGL